MVVVSGISVVSSDLNLSVVVLVVGAEVVVYTAVPTVPELSVVSSPI